MIPVSVNFAGTTLRQDNLIEEMEKLIDRYRVRCEYLEVEVSESYADMNQEMLAETSSKIRKANVRVILDHFGSKNSSFSILSLMEFDGLKLDKSVISNLVGNRRSRLVAKAVIDICRQLGAVVMASGVETQDQVNVLEELGSFSMLCAAVGLIVLMGIAVAGQMESTEQQNQKLLSENQKLTEENERLEKDLNNWKIAKEIKEAPAVRLKEDSENWMLALVNEEYPLAKDYTPASLTKLDEKCSVDTRIYGELEQMIADARQAGLNLYVTSAYRSYDRQREVFDTTMKDWISKGYSPLDAYDETKKSVAVPGTSEHATGLAVDIISGQYTGLDDKQGDTAEQEWLMAHCQEYGFILRFPKDKSNVTGIVYEPWHYRYVGKEAAKKITEQGITLEEYLQAD